MSAAAVRTALVTGASSGIGAAIATQLASTGYRLGLVGRDAGRLASVAARCAGAGAHACLTAAFDIRDRAAFADFVSGLGDIDLYISNAGILDGRREGEVVESREAARIVIEINLIGAIDGLHTVLDGMRRRDSGQIVLVSSLAGLSPLADALAYSASKAGLISYGIALRDALASSGIGVTVACPGYVKTAMGHQHLGNRPHEISAEDAARRILGAAARNRALCGFPFPLHPAAHLSLLVPDVLRRFLTRDLRFTVADR
jgi:short-subunit dehydrogenase